MKWFELSIQTDAEGAEAAAAWLNENVSGGAVIEQTITPEPGEPFDPARTFTVRAFFSAEAAEPLARAQEGLWHLAQLRSMSDPQTRQVAEEDWAEAWKKYYTILHVGQHLVIKPSWLEYVPTHGDIVIELDPGMAFGTGLHPTTRLCLAALEERMTPGARVLDVGTGSGILSIAAARLGASEIVALDTDPIAVETATRNVAISHVTHLVRVQRGSVELAQNSPRFDLICVNILAEVIAEMAPSLAKVLKPGGILIASGILDYKADDVVDAFLATGIRVIEKKAEEDWVAVVGIRDPRLEIGD